MSRIHELLALTVEKHASDLHLKVNAPPMVRVAGRLSAVDGPPLSAADTEQMAREMLNDTQWAQLEARGECDLSYSIPGLSRYRVNVFRQRGCYSLAIRVVPTTVPTF
ncbi:MAG: type IV pili twitching motility protein PilT, partial [Alicyclobacillus sp.]|nr:type IV pili twitching motility protein PilT [Alicyclobacillus sp.]